MTTQNRILSHPVLGNLTNRKEVTFTFDGQTIQALEGETIAASLLANDIRILRHHEETGTPRGIYCNIGHCYECRVTVNGKSAIRSCLTAVDNGMVVESGKTIPSPLKKRGERNA